MWITVRVSVSLVSPSIAVGGSLMSCLERLLDSSLNWYNNNSTGITRTPRRADDFQEKSGVDLRRHRERTQKKNPSLEDIEDIRGTILQQIFQLLANLSWSSEAIGFFAKVS